MPGIVTRPLTTPTLRPGAAVVGFCEMPMMLRPVPPKLVPPNACLPSSPSPVRFCHCTPNSAALSAVSSTISAST